MMPIKIRIFSCKCKFPRKYRLTFDGGSSGNYSIELCESCYWNEDKKYLISEEKLTRGNLANG